MSNLLHAYDFFAIVKGFKNDFTHSTREVKNNE